jgi:hypothetical protein
MNYIIEFSVKSEKTQHQNPEFRPKPGEIEKKKPAKKYSETQHFILFHFVVN